RNARKFVSVHPNAEAGVVMAVLVELARAYLIRVPDQRRHCFFPSSNIRLDVLIRGENATAVRSV
ncbi:MAG TPA: hypothetical protein VNC59_08350, partial [Thermoanaerobaculia bacterium]|nr:hypothetical protein [Thermoanaerobaculia bacterium]